MKRFFTFLLFLCCFSFCSCAGAPQLDTELSAEAKISTGGVDYTVKADNTAEGTISVTMLSPEAVSGVSYHYENSELTVAYEGLKCISDSGFLPQGALADSLYQALSSLPSAQYESSEENTDIFSSGDGRFSYKADAGEIKEVCDKAFGYTFLF